MPTRITRHAPSECGCQATSFYSWSDCGNFDDGDVVEDLCPWHRLQQDAFNVWIERRPEGDQHFDEAYWLQVVEAEDEALVDTFVWERAWSQVRPASEEYLAF